MALGIAIGIPLKDLWGLRIEHDFFCSWEFWDGIFWLWICQVNLADLNNDEDQASKKIRLCIEEVQGRSCLTDFYGMTLTRDKICSLIKKWQTLIEAHVDVKTTDGYVVRLFCIAFTKRRPDQVRANCYAQSAQIRRIRKKMVEIMSAEASKVLTLNFVKSDLDETHIRIQLLHRIFVKMLIHIDSWHILILDASWHILIH